VANNRIIYRDYDLLEPVPTSHLIGLKKVILSNSETISNITQLALSKLFANDKVQEHIHPTMDEHFIVVSGEGIIQIDNENYDFKAGKFILVPAGSYHNISAKTDIEFITISVAL
jgi:mannose-6-phosphate isomerase-like protein (cupin superfamily)